MPFERGKPKTGGRQSGTMNRFTGAFREAVQIVYHRLGGHAAFLNWARDNPTEYYRIAARLIPGEMQQDGRNNPIQVFVYGKPVGTVLDVQPALPDHATNEGGSSNPP
jgi:hypothetical protein